MVQARCFYPQAFQRRSRWGGERCWTSFGDSTFDMGDGGDFFVANAELLVEAGRMKGQRFQVPEGRTVAIGRSIRSDIQIPDRGASRIHCRLTNGPDGAVLTDLGSSNGTLVNGKLIESTALSPGDLICIGSFEMRFGLVASGDAPEGVKKLPETTIDLVKGKVGAASVRKRYDSTAATLSTERSRNAEVARLQARLGIICDMASTINSEIRVEAVYDAAARAILAISAADRSAIVMLDETSGEPVPVATYSGSNKKSETSFPLSRTILDETLRQGVSVISSDAADDDRFKAGASIVMQNIRGVMCVPLRTEEKIIGAIYVDSSTGHTIFSENELVLLAAIGHQVGVAVERVRLIDDLEKLFVGAMHTVIASIEAKDAYTRGHSERVTAYALMISDELHLSGPERSVVELAGVLHDVGKIGVPEVVLLKPGKLSGEELAVIRKHPEDGVHIIRNMPQIDRIVSFSDISDAVLHHHEAFEGSGYPHCLKGAEIPLASRILAVADTFDAITSDRPYRKAGTPAKAAAIIDECAGSQFDPDIAAAFLRVHERGDTVRLDEVKGRFRITRKFAAINTDTQVAN